MLKGNVAEEVENPATSVPRSMVLTVLINGILAFGWIIALLFCIGDVDVALDSPTGYPIIEIFRQATGSIPAATAMTSAIIIVAFFATLGILASTSRLTWAFARDKGLPFSDFLSYVRESFVQALEESRGADVRAGEPTLQNPNPDYNPCWCCRLPVGFDQRRFDHRIQRYPLFSDFDALCLIFDSHHHLRPSKDQTAANSLWAFSVGPVWLIYKHFCHRLCHLHLYFPSFSFEAAGDQEKHELCQSGFRFRFGV